MLQIGAYNEGEHTGGVNLVDILRPGSRGAAPIDNVGDLRALTQELCPADSSFVEGSWCDGSISRPTPRPVGTTT